MAANRYGQIWHGDHHHINLRFPSVDSRKDYADKFSEYHGSHDHDGEAPRFELVNASDINAGSSHVTIHDVKYVTLDGYCAHEIEEYHERTHKREYTRYRPPTCCVPPIISINREFVPSHTLDRHELSAIFGDMPADDYQSLLASVQRDGFIDEVIKLYDGKILDGWHRYCAARELNLIRKLRFQVWHEDDHRDGDPKAFVLARNIERRHLSAGQRAQIVVSFNDRFGMGRPKGDESVPSGTLKSREELAQKAGVGVRTIARAVEVEKEGESEAVIRGEKTAGEVIKARDAATAKKRKKQVLKNMWDTRIQAARDYTGDGDTDLNQCLTLPELEMGFIRNNESYADAFGSGMQRIDAAASFKDFEDRAFEVDKFGVAKVDISELEEEYRAILTYSGDIRQWKREDWSPDTNWILPLIEAKKAESAPKPEPVSIKLGELEEKLTMYYQEHQSWDGLSIDALSDEYKCVPSQIYTVMENVRRAVDPGDNLKTLREQVKAQMSKYKQWYKDQGYQESDLVSRASFSQLIHVFREYRETPQEGAATIEELKDLLELLKSKSYPFAYKLRQIVRPEQLESDTVEALEDDAEKAEALSKFHRQKRDLYAQIQETPLISVKDEFGNMNTDKARHRVLSAAYSAYELPEDLLWSDQAVEALSTEEISKLTG